MPSALFIKSNFLAHGHEMLFRESRAISASDLLRYKGFSEAGCTLPPEMNMMSPNSAIDRADGLAESGGMKEKGFKPFRSTVLKPF